jgi:hypothetical protein
MTESPPSANVGEETDSTVGRGSAAGTYPGMPRWVKLGAMIAIVVILLVVVVMALTSGEHGPFRHVPSGSGTAPQIAIALLTTR